MSTPQNATHVDVLIVGAGPAGLMSAVALGQAGVKVKIIDQRPEVVAAGQADSIMPRTLELFQSYGILDPVLKQANRVNLVSFYNPREGGGIKRTGRLPMVAGVNARYPWLMTLNQGAIERILLDKISTFGISVDRPIRPSSLVVSSDEKEVADPAAYPVKAVLDHLDAEGKETSTEVVFAKFAIGTDGAHSWVRKALGIEMEGEQTDHVWGAIDITTTPESNFPDWRNICTINAHNTTIMSIPREDNKMRLYLDLGLEDGLLDNGRVSAQSVNSERLLKIAREALKPYTLEHESIDWWTAYVVGQRVAARFSEKERVFIAGDACHTHSPKGGQGMNVSMNDAHNLGWKLAYVIKGQADMSLLKTYEFERRKFAQELIAFDKWYEAGFSVKARSELFKDKPQAVVPVEPFQAFLAFNNLTSGVGIQYNQSIIVNPTETSKSLASSLVIGQRIPPQIVLHAADFTPIDVHDVCPSNSRFKVLAFPGDISQATQKELLVRFSDEIFAPNGLVSKLGPAMVDVITILKGEKETTDYFEVPAPLRKEWTKVFLDSKDAIGTQGGQLYESYGIRPEGAVVVVRPDGYVCTVTGLDEVKSLEKFFGGFMQF